MLPENGAIVQARPSPWRNLDHLVEIRPASAFILGFDVNEASESDRPENPRAADPVVT
jgi:hypothetical protein